MGSLDAVGWSYLLGTAVCLATAGVALRYRDAPGGKVLPVVLGGAGLWSLSKLARASLTLDRATAVWVDRLVLVWSMVTVGAYLVFVLSFVGWDDLVDRRLVGLLAIEPAVVLTLSLIDLPGMRLWWYHHDAAAGTASAAGPFFHVHVGYWYLVMGVATLLLLRAALGTSRFYAGQFVAVLVGALTPWLANAFFLWGPLAVNLTPAAFTVTGVALGYAVARHDFMAAAPVARETLVETIDAAMFVLDDEGRLVDCNPAFAELFDLDRGAIGDPAAALLADHPELRAALDDDEDGAVITLDLADGRRFVEVSISPVGPTDAPLGRLVLLHDVTPQQRRQRELQRQNEQLDRFASVVSHDLRTPLSVARGRAELALESGDDAHLEEVIDTHDRMADLLEDVHALARQGKSIDDPEPVDLAAVAEDAWTTTDTREATLEILAEGRVVADRQRLRQLFENLFENAVTHGGPDVTVTVGRLDDGSGDTDTTTDGFGSDTGFYVADDGPGLPAAAGDDVFEWGYTEAEDGSGLGLAIVDQIARAHGWKPAVVDGGTRSPDTAPGGDIDGDGNGDSNADANDDTAQTDREGTGARFEFRAVEWV